MLDTVRIALIDTSHPGNIGAAARAMKTMGLRRLVLVQPRQFPCAEATARASGADDVLARAEVYDQLLPALAGSRLVVGASARRRSVPWPMLNPAECARKVQEAGGDAVILFGREHSGLSNEELDLCHYLVQISANPEYSSLNLAAAVQILAYELRCLSLLEAPPEAAAVAVPASEQPVTQAEMERFYQHLQQALIDIDFFDPAKPKRLLRRLHRLFNRIQPNQSELNILRGILTAAQTAARNPRRRGGSPESETPP